MSNSILDNTSFFALLFRWRKKIIIVSFIAAVIAVVVSLFIPNKYESEVIIFPTMNLSTGKALLNDNVNFLEIGEEEELEQKVVTENEKGEEVTTTKKIKKILSKDFFIKKPTRRLWY